MAFDAVTYAAAVGKSNKYTDDAISHFPKGLTYKGSVDYYSDLPNNAESGDTYTVKYEGTSGTSPLGTEYGWGKENNTMTWIDLGPDLSQYQKLLVSGTNIKTINGNSILGSGDMVIATNQEFPQTWPTTGTTKAFCDVVNADSTATKGKSFLGEVTWSDFPTGIANAEVVVQIMDGTGTTNKVIHLILTSGNVAPYRWEYTYWNNGSNVSGWIPFLTQTDADSRYLQLSGGAMTGDITIGGGSARIKGTNGDPIVKQLGATDYFGDASKSAQIITGNSDVVHNKDGTTYNILDASNTSANPTLSGGEADLTSLKLNGTSYKIPGRTTFVDWS